MTQTYIPEEYVFSIILPFFRMLSFSDNFTVGHRCNKGYTLQVRLPQGSQVEESWSVEGLLLLLEGGGSE